MADIVDLLTPAQQRDVLRQFMAAAILAATGEAWDATDADGAALVLEAVGQVLSDIRAEFNGDVEDLLPSETSPYLPNMVRLLGITPGAGESNPSLWTRRAVLLQQASLGSPVALRDLLFSEVDGIVDATFARQTDGSQKVYLVSDADPPSGSLQGATTPGQDTSAGALLNAGDSAHVGVTFAVTAPTISGYSIVATVHYDAQAVPNTPPFQAAVAEAAQEFVRGARGLGIPVAIGNFHAATKLEGVVYVDAAFYTIPDLTVLNPVQADDVLDPGDDATFYSCNDAVNVISALAEGTVNEINLIYQPVT